MSSAASTTALRKVMQERLSALGDEFEVLWANEATLRAKEESALARRRLAEDLNQAVRRLRQAADLEEICATLADASLTFCNVAATFGLSHGRVSGLRLRGGGYEGAAERFRKLEFPVAEAEAIAGVVETRDPVVTISMSRQLSPAVVDFFGHSPDERVYLFPVSVEQKPQAVLYATGDVQAAPLELLAQTASAALEVRVRRTPPPPEPVFRELVKIMPIGPPRATARPTWDELTPEEQQRHLRAQRFARVHVAEMRLYHAAAVKSGRRGADLYGELRESIDSARAAYRQSFLEGCPSMLDYLHLELVRTLANDDDTLLGKDYPGPLV